MNHRIVAFVSAIIIAALVSVSVLFASAIHARVPEGVARHGAARIPHGIEGDAAACRDCHNVTARSLPLTHRYYSTTTCRSCHAWEAVTQIAHRADIDDSRCPLCHGDPTQDFGMPENHLDYPDGRCSFCHEPDPRTASRYPEPAGEASKLTPEMTHGVTDAFATCTYCHRVDSEPSMPESHRAFTEETCRWCHAPESGVPAL